MVVNLKAFYILPDVLFVLEEHGVIYNGTIPTYTVLHPFGNLNPGSCFLL